MSKHSIYEFSFNEMYGLYIAKAVKKGRTEQEVDEIICWLSGYSKEQIHNFENSVDMTEFFTSAPNLNSNRILIKGSNCGVKIDEIDEPIMKEIRYLDKLVDELAKGKALEKILRR